MINHKKFNLAGALKNISNILLLFMISVLSVSAIPETFQLGDLAPRGAPDGELNAADSLVLERILLGDIFPTEDELLIGDVAPLGVPNGQLNIGDLAVQQRAILGLISLGTVSALPPAPVLADGVSLTNLNPYKITGSARANATVNIYVKGVLQHQLSSNPDGTFAIDVYLFDGVNDIFVTEFDGVDTSAASNTIQVQYNNLIDRNNLPTNISVDTVWTPGATLSPYILSTTFTVDTDVKLVLLPGTVLQFSENKKLIVNGTLIAHGTVTSQILFTNQDGSNWTGIEVNGTATNLKLDYVQIENATTGIKVTGTDIALTNSVLQNNSTGIEIIDGNGSVISNIIQNGVTGISLNNSSPLIQGNQIINHDGFYLSTAIYMVYQSSPIINDNIISNNIIGFSLKGFNVPDGYPQPLVNNNQVDNNVNVETSQYNYSGVIPRLNFQNNWWGTTDVSTIETSIKDYADGAIDRPLIDYTNLLASAGGSVVANNTLLGGDVSDTQPGGNGLVTNTVYLVLGSITVPVGETLTIPEGVTLQFPTNSKLIVNGTLIAQGSEISKILFTSLLTNIGTSYWTGIEVNGTATNLNLNYVQIENATTGIKVTDTDILLANSLLQNNNTGIYVINGNGQIINNIIQNGTAGIWLSDASPSIQGNQILNHNGNYLSTAIELFYQSSPVIKNNIISNNTIGFSLRGLNVPDGFPQPLVNNNQIDNNVNVETSQYSYSGAIPKINFQNNWWGTTDVSTIEKSIKDYADGSTDRPLIDYTNLLASAGGSVVAANTILGGNISDTQPGGNGLVANTAYLVLGSITVPVGETLIIPEGVTLQFPTSSKLIVNGTLIAQGTATSQIMFTSMFTNEGTSNWTGIEVNSTATNLSLDYVRMENAVTGIKVTGTDIFLNNSVLENNSTGISITDGSGKITNNIIQNGFTGISLNNASPLIQDNQIFNHNTIYLNTAIYLSNKSSPVVNGNIISANTIGFSLSGDNIPDGYPQPLVNSNQIDNNVNVETSQYNYSGAIPEIDFQNNWWGTMDVSTIEISIKDYSDGAVDRPLIDYTNLLASAGGSVVAANTILGGNISDTQPDGNGLIANITYMVLGSITVPVGETLTIPEGVTLLFPTGEKLTVNGTLIVQGSINFPVVFTSNRAINAVSVWQGIIVQSGANVIIENSIIEYATYGVQFNSGSDGTVSRTIITDNFYGVYIEGLSNPVIDENTIVNNQYGIFVAGYSGDPQPVITNNDIYSNITNNLYLTNITSTVPLNISGNWWGSDILNDIRSTIGGTNQNILVLLDNIATVANNASVPINMSVSELFISPLSSIGEKDKALLSATLTGPGNWLLEIFNESNKIVRSFPASNMPVSVEWDGTDDLSQPLPDGKYKLILSVDGVKSRIVEVVVDNTLPVATIISPIANATISTTSALNVTGNLSDINIDNYIIEVADSHTPNDTDFRLLTSAQLLTTNSLFTWVYNEVNGVQEYGNKTIRLSVTDKAGNTAKYTTSITLNYLAITNVSLLSDVIDATINSNAGINFTLEQPAMVTLRIYNELEHLWDPLDDTYPNDLVLGTTLVREISQNYLSSGNYTLNWDGLDNAGNAVPQDAYRFELIAENGSESNRYYPQPTLNLFNGVVQQTVDFAEYAFYKNEYVTFTASVPPDSIVRIFLNATTSLTLEGNMTPLNKVVDDGDHIFLIDGRNNEGEAVDSGYIFNVSPPVVYQKDANAIFVKSTPAPVLLGSETYPDIEIKSNPYQIKYSYDQVSSVAFTVSEDSYVTVDLMRQCMSSSVSCSSDPAVSSVKRIIDNELLDGEDGTSATVHSFEWRGYDFEINNADTNNIVTDEEGYYTFLFTATSAVTGLVTTYRSSLLLYH